MFIIVIGIKIANPSTSLHSEGNAILETKCRFIGFREDFGDFAP